MTKISKTVEKVQGCGHIHMSDRGPLSVRYSLVVFRTVDDEAVTGPFTHHIEIGGTIEVSDTDESIELGGQTFTLHTDDGRCLDTWASRGDAVTRKWEISATGPIGLKPC